MPEFSDVLPSIGGIESLVGQKLNQTIQGVSSGFSVVDAQTKISEAATQLVSSLGSIGGFTKLGANLPSFDSISAALARTGQTLLGNQPLAQTLRAASANLNPAATARQIKSAGGVANVSNDHKVTLTEKGTSNVVVFEVLPQVTEAHAVQYEQVAPTQSIGAFMKFKEVAPTQWTISATFISRTPEEAQQNYLNLCQLRGWKEPFWGAAAERQFPKKLGGPPPVLSLRGLRDLIGEVPVVITSLNWQWPNDVDYLPTTTLSPVDQNPLPFPAIMTVDLQVIESYSVAELNSFSLKDYRAGRLKAAFGSAAALSQSTSDGGADYSHEGRNFAGLT